jgi:hypothetical protein
MNAAVLHAEAIAFDRGRLPQLHGLSLREGEAGALIMAYDLLEVERRPCAYQRSRASAGQANRLRNGGQSTDLRPPFALAGIVWLADAVSSGRPRRPVAEKPIVSTAKNSSSSAGQTRRAPGRHVLALLLAYYAPDSRLVYAGRASGTGMPYASWRGSQRA